MLTKLNHLDEWNATITGNYLWSNVNFGEAVTEPMTPLAWSVVQFTLAEWVFVPGFPSVGNIGGRPYLNISVFAALFHALGRSQQDLLNFMETTLYMRLPPGMEIPRVPFSRWQLLVNLPALARLQNKQRQGIHQMPAYLAETPGWFQRVQTLLQAQTNPAGLVALWQDEIVPHVKCGVWCVLGSATHSADYTMQLRRDLAKLVGVEDANRLIALAPDGEGEVLDSLGPLLGLEKLARGEISREAYLQTYGHRGPHEFELSHPRPAEDPAWLDQTLADFQANPVDVAGQLKAQRVAFSAAWERLQSHHPHQAQALRIRLAENARRIRLRERGRSAYVRDRWLIRLFALRAAELLGLGDSVFFLHIDELLAGLSGAAIPTDKINTRREEYGRYLALPAYPSVIRGRFDPFAWAASPQRGDIFDEYGHTQAEKPARLRGSPGSAGRAEGRVRVILDPREGCQLQTGEILVAVQTDVSWTLLFPRAAAVITDVGAPLSHAAIVARELGIPAVVGCGNATQVLKTGDRVLVDGAAGTVEIRSTM
jgi:pyruvate,water dikinase